MRALAERVIACCRELAGFSEEPGRTTRTFLSPPMRDAHRVLRVWMERIGMSVWVDAAGNLRGLYGDATAPRLIIGSHLDTVPNAGAFDGILGVVIGIAMAELQPRTAIEVIGFSEEEGVRFGFPFIGSLAFIGGLTLQPQVQEAIGAFGLDPNELPAARYAPESVAYLEFHIEQGPVLESLGIPLAAVEAIAGQSRFLLTFMGKANHAGTTPMNLRQDALAAAAQWIGEVESYAASHAGLVATVGSLTVSPNAGNVVPGEVKASLDVRHSDDTQRRLAVEDLLAAADRICTGRGIRLTCEQRLNQPAVQMDRDLTDLLGLHRMTSGAGHDAMIVAPHIPSTMMFLRSPGGISHHPDETVLPEDLEAALEAGRRFIAALGAQYA
jgi:allantoate deiminase